MGVFGLACGASAQPAEPPLIPEPDDVPPFAGEPDEPPVDGDDGLTDGDGGACMCPRIHRPVCGDDDTTYPNACVAGCEGVAVRYEGVCRPDPACICVEIWDPVCGVDGQTWGNACQADCAGVLIAYEGECRPGCTCPAVADPVCGVDGVTYGNSCEAGCNGVDVLHRGPCATTGPVDPGE